MAKRSDGRIRAPSCSSNDRPGRCVGVHDSQATSPSARPAAASRRGSSENDRTPLRAAVRIRSRWTPSWLAALNSRRSWASRWLFPRVRKTIDRPRGACDGSTGTTTGSSAAKSRVRTPTGAVVVVGLDRRREPRANGSSGDQPSTEPGRSVTDRSRPLASIGREHVTQQLTVSGKLARQRATRSSSSAILKDRHRLVEQFDDGDFASAARRPSDWIRWSSRVRAARIESDRVARVLHALSGATRLVSIEFGMLEPRDPSLGTAPRGIKGRGGLTDRGERVWRLG